MNDTFSILKIFTLTVTILGGFSLFPIANVLSSPIAKQSAYLMLDELDYLPFVKEGSFGDSGRPNSDRRVSGGSRGPCDDQIIALIPGEQEIGIDEESCSDGSDAFSTETVSQNPTLVFYIPGSFPLETEATLTLFDPADFTGTWREYSLMLPQGPGLIALQPNFNLEVDKTYAWNLEVNLDSGSGRGNNPSVNGTISRQGMTEGSEARLSSIEPLDKVDLYLENNIWHDALIGLMELSQEDSEDDLLIQAWQNLLEEAGLSVLSDQPRLDCCTFKN
jgi:hypothetical protein